MSTDISSSSKVAIDPHLQRRGSSGFIQSGTGGLDSPHAAAHRVRIGLQNINSNSTNSSSAPITTSSSDSSANTNSAEFVRKPNALACLDKLTSICNNKRVGVFLDYDGTLTPIVSDPSAALITDSMKQIVANVAKRFPTAIVTGRGIPTISRFVELPQLYYAGSHGFDIRAPGMKQCKQVAQEFLPHLQEFRNKLQSQSQSIAGSVVEDNVYSISVHYRNVEEANRQKLESLVDEEIAKSGGKLVKKLGKMVWEIRPNFLWHKGLAVEYLMKQMFTIPIESNSTTATSSSTDSAIAAGSNSSQSIDWSTVMPIYCGDDITDEDAFRELQRVCPTAITVFVRPPEKDRETDANYTLNSTDEVQQFLQFLAQLHI